VRQGGREGGLGGAGGSEAEDEGVASVDLEILKAKAGGAKG
jgi:hypothetical protein